MVIKNPYRFISKYYKYICLLMLVPLLYLALKYGDIAKFYRDFIANNNKTPETIITDTYVTGLLLVTLLGMLIVNAFIAIIFATKKRDNLIHIILVLYVIILGVSTVLFTVTMNSIEAAKMELTLIRVTRDLANIISIPGFILIPLVLAKAFNFNFKTFKIERYYESFDYEDEDGVSDEIALNVGEKDSTAKGGIVHLLREAKYYILENKFVFKVIGVILLILLGISTYMSTQVYNKKYNMNQEFVLNNFTMSLKGSYLTNLDYQGNVIAKDKYFLAVKLTIQNKSKKDRSIDSSNFRIFLGKEEIYPSYDRSSRFIDIGKNYHGESIAKQSVNDYVFVYELTEDQLQTQYEMKILTNLELAEDNQLIKSYKIINIKPENILKSKDLGKAKIGSEIDLKETVLGNTKYKLNSIEIAYQYQYDSKSCETCQSIRDTVVPHGGYALLIIKDEITWDTNCSYYKNSNKDFYGDFVKLDYGYETYYAGKANDKHEIVTLKNVTPSGIQDVKIYEVPYSISKADYAKLQFNIRNKTFSINISDKG